jgi:CheY-like chemotaxis protein
MRDTRWIRASAGRTVTALNFLIVDDSPTVRLTVKQAMIQERVPPECVAEAGSAVDAVQVFERFRPDVVFLDVSLTEGQASGVGSDQFLDILTRQSVPPQSGNEVARFMLARNPGLIVVVCTGNPSSDPRVRELIKGGAFRLLEKPIHLAEVRNVLREIRDERAPPAAGAEA